MGHTTQSARLTGLLGLIFMGGLLGLAGGGPAVDAIEPQARESVAQGSGSQPNIQTADRSTATMTGLLATTRSERSGPHEYIPVFPLGLGMYQIQCELFLEPGAGRFCGWLQTHQAVGPGHSQLGRSPDIVNATLRYEGSQSW